jgi:transcriptional regulator with XRE-family HTH domain
VSERKPDVMARVRTLFERSGLSLEELGKRMGYSETVARKSAWQFLNKTVDPRLSMLQRFASALSLPLRELIK